MACEDGALVYPSTSTCPAVDANVSEQLNVCFHVSEEIKNSLRSRSSACCHSRQAYPRPPPTLTLPPTRSISTANRNHPAPRAPSLQITAGAFIHVNTHKQLQADDKDVMSNKVEMLTSGPDYICQSGLRAVTNKTIIY